MVVFAVDELSSQSYYDGRVPKTGATRTFTQDRVILTKSAERSGSQLEVVRIRK